jgi:hypothetical protein
VENGSGPATATSANLFADTWELPVGAQDPGPDPGPDGELPTLVSFTIEPEVIQAGGSFTIALGIDQPAEAPVQVSIEIEGGGPAGSLTIDTGQTTVVETAGGLPEGSYVFIATLGEVTLTATVVIQ